MKITNDQAFDLIVEMIEKDNSKFNKITKYEFMNLSFISKTKILINDFCSYVNITSIFGINIFINKPKIKLITLSTVIDNIYISINKQKKDTKQYYKEKIIQAKGCFLFIPINFDIKQTYYTPNIEYNITIGDQKFIINKKEFNFLINKYYHIYLSNKKNEIDEKTNLLNKNIEQLFKNYLR